MICLLVLPPTASEILCLHYLETSTSPSAFMSRVQANKLTYGCSVGSVGWISGTNCLISPWISNINKPTDSLSHILIYFLVSVNIVHSSFVFLVPAPVWILRLPPLHVHGLDSIYLHNVSPSGNKGPNFWWHCCWVSWGWEHSPA